MLTCMLLCGDKHKLQIGTYRDTFHREAHSNYYDYLMSVENDMNITYSHLGISAMHDYVCKLISAAFCPTLF